MKNNNHFILFLTFILLVSCTLIKTYSISKSELPVIYIDPGHGGYDGGATSLDKTVLEKDINLACSYYLKDFLEKSGFKVYLTRNADNALSNEKRLDMKRRVKLINDSKAQIFISIHSNAFSNRSVSGAQTFYSNKDLKNELLSKHIMDELNKISTSKPRKEKVLLDKYILDKTTKVGCLIELGFLTNDSDLNTLTNPVLLEKIAFSIYLGVMSYYEEID